MTVNLQKSVFYSSNERLDLNDMLAEMSLMSKTMYEDRRVMMSHNDPDGRVFFGWRTTTVSGPNSGFVVAAEPAFAITRDGYVLARDGSSTLTIALSANVINYVYAYYIEAQTDVDNRRFYIAGAETTQTVPTRITRTAGIHVDTKPYGTPAYADFSQSANIGGNVVQLVPLYAVPVNAGNTITSVEDFRPMLAIASDAAGGNKYQAAVPDLPHPFTPSPDPATIGIVGWRSTMVALADRLKNIKNTTNWYDDNFDAVKLNGGGAVYSAFNNSSIRIAGGSGPTTGAYTVMFGGAHPTQASRVEHYANRYLFSSQLGTTIYAEVNGTLGTFAVRTLANCNITMSNQTDAELAAVNDLNNAYVTLRINAAPLLIGFNSGGQVGIGSSVTPAVGTQLDVGAAGGIRSRNFIETPSDYAFNSYFSGGWKYRANGYAAEININSFLPGYMTLLRVASGTAGNACAWTNGLAMSLDSGFIGIGNNPTPAAMVDILQGIAAWTPSIPASGGYHGLKVGTVQNGVLDVAGGIFRNSEIATLVWDTYINLKNAGGSIFPSSYFSFASCTSPSGGGVGTWTATCTIGYADGTFVNRGGAYFGQYGAMPHAVTVALVGDTTYTYGGLYLSRAATGANAASYLAHRGTGDFALVAYEAAAMLFSTSSVERLRIAADGSIGTNGTTTPSTYVAAPGGLVLYSTATVTKIFALCDSAVNHGVTTFLPTDNYFAIGKYNPTGGLSYVTINLGGPISEKHFAVAGTADSNIGDTAQGTITLRASLKSGTGTTTFATGDNLFAITNNDVIVAFRVTGQGNVMARGNFMTRVTGALQTGITGTINVSPGPHTLTLAGGIVVGST